MGEVVVKKSETLWDQLQKMEERIMKRAYDIFQGSGSQTGNDLDNWLTAERELVLKPAIELKEKDNTFEIKVAVAGVDPRDLKVEVTAEDLLVRRETTTEKSEDKEKVHYSEFESASLFRSIRFPKKVNADNVRAELKNGLLTIVAPIAEEAKARIVKVSAA